MCCVVSIAILLRAFYALVRLVYDTGPGKKLLATVSAVQPGSVAAKQSRILVFAVVFVIFDLHGQFELRVQIQVAQSGHADSSERHGKALWGGAFDSPGVVHETLKLMFSTCFHY